MTKTYILPQMWHLIYQSRRKLFLFILGTIFISTFAIFGVAAVPIWSFPNSITKSVNFVNQSICRQLCGHYKSKCLISFPLGSFDWNVEVTLKNNWMETHTIVLRAKPFSFSSIRRCWWTWRWKIFFVSVLVDVCRMYI